MAVLFWTYVIVFCVIKNAECLSSLSGKQKVLVLVHSQDASIEKFPYVVVFVEDMDNPQPYCQGVLLRDEEADTSANIVISTANCMCRKDGKDYALNHLTAILGGFNEPTSVTRKLRVVECMPKFDLRQSASYKHDIAMVVLSTPVDFTDQIRGVDMIREFAASITPESECYVASYGPIEVTVDGADIYPKKLQKIKMHFVEGTNGECGLQIQMSNGTLLCAKSLTWPNRAAPGRVGPGDEGSAMVCRIDGRWVLAGIKPSDPVKVVDSVVFDLNDEL